MCPLCHSKKPGLDENQTTLALTRIELAAVDRILRLHGKAGKCAESSRLAPQSDAPCLRLLMDQIVTAKWSEPFFRIHQAATFFLHAFVHPTLIGHYSNIFTIAANLCDSLKKKTLVRLLPISMIYICTSLLFCQKQTNSIPISSVGRASDF